MEIAELVTRDVLDDFSGIKNRYKINDEKFKRGMDFCVRVSSGDSRVYSWVEIFGETSNPARDSLTFMRAGWVDAILMKMQVGNNLRHLEVRSKILERMSTIALDEEASNKSSIDAAKVFLENTNMPEQLNVDVELNINEDAQNAMNAFLGTMQAIASGKAPMIGTDGKFIETELIT